MVKPTIKSITPLWQTTQRHLGFAPLKRDITVDVVVVGAGITGLTAALRLSGAGKKVAVIEMHFVGAGETGHTTAHLTEMIDTGYTQLTKDFGKEGAKLAAQSSREAIEIIARNCAATKVDCQFHRLPAYIYSEYGRDLDELKEELQAAKTVGLTGNFLSKMPLPFQTKGGLCVENQARFNPTRYLEGLSQAITAQGGLIFENTQAVEFTDGEPVKVRTEGGTITATDAIIATNSPISNRFFLQTKIAAYRTYAIAFDLLEPLPSDGLYWDTADPYHYIRTQEAEDGRTYLIVGGEDHKTGTKVFTDKCFERLDHYTRIRFKVGEAKYQWSGQIIEPVDGLPYIGRNSLSKHEYVATGYSGNGMTFGTTAGILLSDEILGKKNPWAALYDATRIKPIASAVEYLSENKDYPLCMVKDRLAVAEARSLADVLPGEGKTVSVDGEKLAVFRDERGKVHAMSPVCPHLGCHVHFNSAEKSWDCPCHGSRFDAFGHVLNGPAISGLKEISLTSSVPKKKEKESPRQAPGAA